MDFARDHGLMSMSDREKLFKYASEQNFRQTTVISALDGQSPTQVILDTNMGWSQWQEEKCPRPDGSHSGTVVILAGRDLGEQAPRRTDNASNDLNIEGGPSTQFSTGPKRAHDRDSDEKPMDFHLLGRYRRGLRSLPFSAEIFRQIMKSLFIHGDIARVISRADIPTFSVSEITMGDWPAYVIQLRTTNAWGMDLALSCTFFPHCMLTFAIVFGSAPTVEAEIIRRITLAPEDTAHPLLVAGIVLELERARHAGIVENSIDKLEGHVLALDSFSAEMYDQSETARKNITKRNEWLDMAYLRNQLISWETQVLKFIACAESLNKTVFSTEILALVETSPTRGDVETISAMEYMDAKGARSDSDRDYSVTPEPNNQPLQDLQGIKSAYNFDIELPNLPSPPSEGGKQPHDTAASLVAANQGKAGIEEVALVPGRTSSVSKRGLEDGTRRYQSRKTGVGLPRKRMNSKAHRQHMRRIGSRFAARASEIRDEYSDKVRDCKMRLDGMAMASQWAEGESNVHIALEMRRDSRHMRSIALVTMVFLPGTFFASVFSMTFFNWFPDSSPSSAASKNSNAAQSSESVVSSHVWIWVVFTVVATSATFIFWYYFIVYRGARARKLRAKNDAGGTTAKYHPKSFKTWLSNMIRPAQPDMLPR